MTYLQVLWEDHREIENIEYVAGVQPTSAKLRDDGRHSCKRYWHTTAA